LQAACGKSIGLPIGATIVCRLDVRLEKPNRRATSRNFELTHYPDDLVQRQVWLQFNQCQQKVGVLLQRRRAPTARFGGIAAGARLRTHIAIAALIRFHVPVRPRFPPRSDLPVGRRRLHHADGRFPEPRATRHAGQGRDVHQWRAARASITRISPPCPRRQACAASGSKRRAKSIAISRGARP
jgi:hypothetical protein